MVLERGGEKYTYIFVRETRTLQGLNRFDASDPI